MVKIVGKIFRDLSSQMFFMMKRHVWQPRKWFDAKDGPFMSTWFEESVFFGHFVSKLSMPQRYILSL